MNRPELKACSITPNPANVKATLAIVIEAEDVEIVFGTDYKYAGTEVYAGEEGII
ncbi:MAG: hypothetical protein IJ335_01240 [Lachnospiraceae bacterium]|nr:hypothetical protein [Lachnospiraceae bacterium]